MTSEGASGITHVGEIRRSDGSHFTFEEASKLLDCLFWFFSFCKSHWTGPLLFVGYDDSQNEVCRRLSSTRVIPEHNRRRWLCHIDRNSLPPLFPGFYAKWFDAQYFDYIKTCLYWYIDANIPGRGAEGSIVTLCALFEAVTWMELVGKSNMTPSQYKSSTAARLSPRDVRISNTHLNDESETGD